MTFFLAFEIQNRNLGWWVAGTWGCETDKKHTLIFLYLHIKNIFSFHFLQENTGLLCKLQNVQMNYLLAFIFARVRLLSFCMMLKVGPTNRIHCISKRFSSYSEGTVKGRWSLFDFSILSLSF